MIEEKGISFQEDLINISSQISKQLKKSFGKGPESCYCVINKQLKMLVVQVRHFLTPAEEVLVGKNELNLALSYRSVIIKAILEESLEDISDMAGFQIQSFFYDWNYEKNTGVLLMLGEKEDEIQRKSLWKSMNCSSLEKVVEEVFFRYHKVPRKVQTFEIHPNSMLVQCDDVHLPIENTLLKKGHGDLLMEHCITMRQHLYEYKINFENVLQRRISDMYFLRDAMKDKGYLIFFLKRDLN
ncbi:Na-translocating system protein MpsC family protein [Evansella tamaricis]|uniref:DUF2294 domain-containing protein n=1 Tax=Evansella tamaricis TaxID=2069301 RepID=A0ABS6JKC8_9BACI|nr:Na-translocating system protein MpsC family protein [Evansella tamaricis]MBU9714041.1 DUF2294 domain-containing protein [Evansella tamaricis]